MNYILEYYQQIQEGRVTVGRWVNMLYTKIVHGIENKEFYFDPKKANKAIGFIETYTHHSKGRLAPKQLKLELWQKAMISCIFGIVDKNGKRKFQEIVIVMGRKQGKSLLAGGITQKMAFASGEHGADCYMIAPKLDQADIVYGDVVQSIEYEPELKHRIKRRRSDIYIPESNSTIKKIPFSQKRSDGLSPYCTICDEFGAWQGDAGLKQYEVITSALGAREEPIVFSISTANYVNDGIYDELIKRGTAWLLGSSKENRLLPIFYMIDDVEKWNDINELQKSLPNLGVSVSVDFILEEIAKAEGSLSKKAEFITKYCCIKQNSSTAWLDYNTVDSVCGEELNIDDFRHSYCVCGIDLSQTTDLTSCCAVVEKNGELYVFSHFFMPANKLEEATANDGVPYDIFRKQGFLTLSGENFVDYRDCYNWIVDLMRKHEIIPLIIGYDRYSAQYLVDDIKAAGLKCDDVYQGHNLTPVIREFEGIIKDGKIHIGNNNLLKSHLLNVALKQDVETQKVKMIKSGTRTRIDGAAALMDAMCVRQKWYGEIGNQLTNRR